MIRVMAVINLLQVPSRLASPGIASSARSVANGLYLLTDIYLGD